MAEKKKEKLKTRRNVGIKRKQASCYDKARDFWGFVWVKIRTTLKNMFELPLLKLRKKILDFINQQNKYKPKGDILLLGVFVVAIFAACYNVKKVKDAKYQKLLQDLKDLRNPKNPKK